MRFISSITLLALSAIILAFQLPAQADMSAKVVSIGDGDGVPVAFGPKPTLRNLQARSAH